MLDQQDLSLALRDEKIISIFNNSQIAVTNKGSLIDLSTMERSEEL